jgi:hypothetical protein
MLASMNKSNLQAHVEKIMARWVEFCAQQERLAEYREALEAERDAKRTAIRKPDNG